LIAEAQSRRGQVLNGLTGHRNSAVNGYVWSEPTLLLLLLLITAISPLSALAESKNTIKLGALSELTGPGAKNGEACQLGYRIAFNLFRETYPQRADQIEIVYGDHRREAKTAIAEFQRLKGLGVWSIAANHSIIGVAINPLSKSERIPLFGVMGHESFVRDNPFAYRIIPTAQQEGGGLAQKAFERGVRKAATLILEDDYILALGAAFEKHFRDLGGEVTYRDSVFESERDFSAIALRIRAAQPDAILMTLGFQQFGPAVRRLREQGVTQPIYANYWLSYPDVINAALPKHLEESIFVTERSEFPVFLREYNKLAAGHFRSGVVFRCYTALSVPLTVLGANPTVRTKDDFLSALEGVSALDLPDRKLLIKDREALFESQFFIIRDGVPAALP
jgi:branched-chain amino acid transport system substrate-binding protein